MRSLKPAAVSGRERTLLSFRSRRRRASEELTLARTHDPPTLDWFVALSRPNLFRALSLPISPVHYQRHSFSLFVFTRLFPLVVDNNVSGIWWDLPIHTL